MLRTDRIAVFVFTSGLFLGQTFAAQSQTSAVVSLSQNNSQPIFCVSDGRQWSCSREAHFAAAEVERPFLHVAGKHEVIELGVLKAGEELIQTSISNPHLSFTVAEQEHALNDPVTISFTQNGTGRMWSLALPGRIAAKRNVAIMPKGDYEIHISSPHYEPIRENLRVSPDLPRRNWVLHRYPTISGTVRTPQGTPVVGAFATAGNGLYTAKTDGAGAFSIEVHQEWPENVLITYPGMATKTVGVKRDRGDHSLGIVIMNSAAHWRLLPIGQSAQDLKSVTLSIASDSPSPTPVRSRSVTDTSEVIFEDLDQGTYEAILKGTDPLEQYGIAFELRAGTTYESSVVLTPIPMHIAVTRGGKPLPKASVSIRNMAHGWNTKLTTDDQGTIASKFWQTGEYIISVKRVEQSLPFVVVRNLDDGADLHLELPSQTVFGSVQDRKGQPIGGAELQVESVYTDSRTSSLPARANAEGLFDLDLAPGVHTITGRAEGYVSAEPVRIEIHSINDSKELKIVLARAVARHLRVATRLGSPVRQATIIQMRGDQLVGRFTTDDEGDSVVQAADESNDVVYALPKEGSFGVLRLRDKRSQEAMQLVVPEGTASLELRAIDDRGDPIPNVRFLMRMDGEVIPPAVTAFAEMVSGFRARTDARGVAMLEHLPPSFLELWPLRTRPEIQDVLASVSARAPVQIGLQPGKNSAVMTFQRKR
jgi:hypothetical protein